MKIVYSMNGVGKIGQICAEKCRPPSYTTNKNKFKWIKALSVRPENLITIKEDIGRKISNMAYRNILSDIYPQARETKEKNKQMRLHQTKSFCTAEENINKIKTTHKMREHFC